MRVVHFAHAPVPYQTPLFNAISQRVDLHVVYLSKPPEERRGRLWTSFDDPWGVPPGFDFSFAEARSLSIDALDFLARLPRRLGPLLDLLAPDAVSVTSWSLPSLPVVAWAKNRGVPVLMWTESSRSSGLLRDPVSNSYRRWVIGQCDGYLTVGPAAREFVVQLGAQADRCVEAWLPSQMVIAPAVEDRPAEEGAFRVLWVGRLVKLKRPLVAIEAFTRVASEIPGARLTLVGEGPLEDSVRAAANRTTGLVEAVGRIEGKRLASLYASHDVLLMTSVREVWGLVVNEALQHGLFVVSCDRVGSARCLLEEETGQLVPADDVDGFVAALRRAFEATRDPASRSARREGRIRLCTHQAFADRYTEAIQLAAAKAT